MDSYCEVQVLFCDAFQDGNCEALGDLSCMWAEEVEADYLAIVCLVDHDLSITVMHSVFVEIPLQRLIDTTIGYNILCSELFPRVFFTVTHAAVLDGCEDCSCHVFVAHDPGAFVEQS